MDPKQLVTQELVTIPNNVINKDAYLALIEADRRLQQNPNRYYRAKTADVVFDFYQGHINTYQLLEKHDVEDYEIELIKQKSRDFMKMKSALNKFRHRAFKGESKGQGALEDFKNEVLGLFGRMYTIVEVHKVVTLEWGFKVSMDIVRAFHLKYIDEIQAEQDRYIRDWSGLKLVHKKSRLDEYSQLYEHRKVRYEETNSREDYKLLLQTLEAIRKEVEGDRLTVDGGIEINIQQNIQMHINQHVFRELNILDFIVAKVSARIGVDPKKLIYSLENSYYAKFSGFKRPDNNRDTDEIYYPSRELYDFNMIKMKAEEVKIVEEKPKIIEESPEVRNSLMDALLKKKREIVERERKVISTVKPIINKKQPVKKKK